MSEDSHEKLPSRHVKRGASDANKKTTYARLRKLQSIKEKEEVQMALRKAEAGKLLFGKI